MYVLIFALASLSLYAMTWLGAQQTQLSAYSIDKMEEQITQSAMRGGEVLNACKSAAVGTYNITNLIGAGLLPTGFPQETAMGNHWICKVVSGGVSGANVAVVLLDGAPLSFGSFGKNIILNDAALQSNIAYQISQNATFQIRKVVDSDSGMLQNGSTDVVSVRNGITYSLAGIVNSLTYSTPVFVSGLVSSSSN